MKTQYLMIIIVYILSISPQITAMSCAKAVGDKNLTVQSLGKAWQTAHWRNGMHPFRYYNATAIKRVVEDQDLIPVAQSWIDLNKSTSNGAFLDLSYQYLIILGDLRVKLKISFEDTQGKSKFMLWYFELVLKRYKNGEDVSQDIKLISSFIDKYTNPDGGFHMKMFDEGMKYFKDNMMPRYAVLKMVD